MILEPQSRLSKFCWSILVIATAMAMALYVAVFIFMFLIPERVVRIAQHDPIVHTVTKAFIYPGPVTWAIGVLVLLVNFFFIYRAMSWRRQFLLQMTIYNLVFLGALFFFVPRADQFARNVLFPYPRPYDPYYAGYHLAVLPIGVMVVLLAIWFWAQWKLTSGRKRKVEEL